MLSKESTEPTEGPDNEEVIPKAIPYVQISVDKYGQFKFELSNSKEAHPGNLTELMAITGGLRTAFQMVEGTLLLTLQKWRQVREEEEEESSLIVFPGGKGAGPN